MARPTPEAPGLTGWLSLAHGAEYADMSTDTIKNAIIAGDLPAYRTGERNHWRLRVTDLDAWLRGDLARERA